MAPIAKRYVPPVFLYGRPTARTSSLRGSIHASQVIICPLGEGVMLCPWTLGNMLFGAQKEKTAQFALDPL